MKHTKDDIKSQKETKKSEDIIMDENMTDANVEEGSAETPSEEPTDEPSAELSEIEVAKKTIDELQKKLAQLNDLHLRSLAEFDNYRKRTLKEKADLIKTGGESVLINILGVVDDVERGIASSENTQDVEALREGMELIHSKFAGFLKQNGLKEIETEGQDFNTDLHEAIATIPAPDESLKGKVIDCVQKGYYLHDKVIRFAKVVVGE